MYLAQAFFSSFSDVIPFHPGESHQSAFLQAAVPVSPLILVPKTAIFRLVGNDGGECGKNAARKNRLRFLIPRLAAV